jgi:hypothetical protein
MIQAEPSPLKQSHFRVYTGMSGDNTGMSDDNPRIQVDPEGGRADSMPFNDFIAQLEDTARGRANRYGNASNIFHFQAGVPRSWAAPRGTWRSVT